MGKKGSVGAFSLEISPGPSGTNAPLIFLHIPSVVPAGVRLQNAGTAPCSQPSSHPSPPRSKGSSMAAPSRPGACRGKYRTTGAPGCLQCRGTALRLSRDPQTRPTLPPPTHLVGATLLFLNPLWPPAPPGNAGSPPPSLPCMGQASLRIKKSRWTDLCSGCIPQDPALFPAQD